jgi:hypothetical protein
MVRMQRAAEAAAFGCWCHMWQEKKQHRVKMARALGKLLNAQMGAAFMQWQDTWRETRRLRSLGQKCMVRMQCAALWAVFNAWWNSATRLRKRRELARKALARILNLRLAFCFGSWLAQYTLAKTQRALQHKVVSRIRHIKIATWFDRMAVAVDMKRRREHTLLRALQKLKNWLAHKVFGKWVGVVHGVAAQQVLRKKSVARILYAIGGARACLRFIEQSRLPSHELVCRRSIPNVVRDLHRAEQDYRTSGTRYRSHTVFEGSQSSRCVEADGC